MRAGVTVTMRKRSSGYRICGMLIDSLDHAYTIACVLVRSHEYAECYAVGTDYSGGEVFVVNLQPAAYVPSSPARFPAPQPFGSAPALPHGASHGDDSTRPRPWGEVVDPEVDPFAPRRALPPRRY